MGNKASFDSVNKLFLERGYTLLDDRYVNNKIPLRYVCSKHPDRVQTIRYNDLQRGRGCRACGYERNADKSRLTLGTVRAEFAARGYTLVSDEYPNAHALLKYVCPKHPGRVREIRLYALRNGQGCADCAREDQKLSVEVIREQFRAAGYVLLDAVYKGYHEKLRYMCPNHPSNHLSMTPARLKAGDGCPFCYFENMSGENNPNWKGGLSELNNTLRAKIWGWKAEARERLGVCYISGSRYNLHVHHARPFHQIRDEALANTGLTLRKTIGEYSVVELDSLVSEFLRLHKRVPAVLLRKDIHELFHKIHGFEATLSDLYEFKQMFLRGELEREAVVA